MSAIKLTDEMRRALSACPAGPIPVEDEQTHSHYVLLAKEDYFRLHEDYVRRELEVAFDQVDRDEVKNLDMTELIHRANLSYTERQQRKT